MRPLNFKPSPPVDPPCRVSKLGPGAWIALRGSQGPAPISQGKNLDGDKLRKRQTRRVQAKSPDRDVAGLFFHGEAPGFFPLALIVFFWFCSFREYINHYSPTTKDKPPTTSTFAEAPLDQNNHAAPMCCRFELLGTLILLSQGFQKRRSQDSSVGRANKTT